MAEKTSQAMIDKARELRASAVSLSGIRDQTGLSLATILKYARDVPKGTCPCGRPGGHRGWCETLFLQHPGAREMLQSKAARINTKWSDRARELCKREWEKGTRENIIATEVTKMLGAKVPLTPHSIRVMAGKLGAHRPPGYRATRCKENMKIYWDGVRAKRDPSSVTIPPTPPPVLATASFISPVISPILQTVPLPAPRESVRGVPFSMSAMAGRDPLREQRLAQMSRSSAGRV